MAEVARSIRVGSTPFSLSVEPAAFLSRVARTLGGLIAAEATFSSHAEAVPLKDGSPHSRFVFAIEMANRDRPLLEALAAFLGVGSLRDYPARKPGWQPGSLFSISSIATHLTHTIPFADHVLPHCAKRNQFVAWRADLLAYRAAHPPRERSICSVEECDRPVRGRGLCRSHYYRATGY